MKKLRLDIGRAVVCIPLLVAGCAANQPAVQEPPQPAPAPAVAVAPAPAAAPVAAVPPAPAAAAPVAAGNVLAAPPTAAPAAEGHTEAKEPLEPYFEKFALYDTSLTTTVHTDSSCIKVWEVMTTIDSLQKWAPHLHLTSINGQKVAQKRGDAVNFMVERTTAQVTGQFILASPVPHNRVQAVVVPQKGPWVRIQEWNMIPEGNNKCRVDYNEAYNELWVRAQGLEKSGFISKIREHHIHVVLRRMKNLSEGKEAGTPEETAYLMEDAKNFPDKLRNVGK